MSAFENRLKALEAVTEAAHPTPIERPAHYSEEAWNRLPPHLQQLVHDRPPLDVDSLPPHLRALLDDEEGRSIGSDPAAPRVWRPEMHP